VAVVPLAIAPSDGDQEARRRRRRRGGRGRGRTRRDEEAGPTVGSEEVGWEEFDDVSQVDGAREEREYTFEEADATTLAELGLSPEEVAELQSAVTPAEADATAPKPRRRSTRAKAAEAVVEPAADVTAPKPRRRSTRAKAAEAVVESDATVDAPASKPRRRSTRAKAGETVVAEMAASADESGEPQGIWGRFRSARKPRGTTG
jgi:ribonuclease E